MLYFMKIFFLFSHLIQIHLYFPFLPLHMSLIMIFFIFLSFLCMNHFTNLYTTKCSSTSPTANITSLELLAESSSDLPVDDYPVGQSPTVSPTESSSQPPLPYLPSVKVSQPPLRKSSRFSKPPSWLSDFVCFTNPSSSTSLLTSTYPISDCISYNHLPSHTRMFTISLSSIVEPQTYQMEIGDKRWIEAMQ